MGEKIFISLDRLHWMVFAAEGAIANCRLKDRVLILTKRVFLQNVTIGVYSTPF